MSTPAGLLSPRAASRSYTDVGDRPALMAAQRVRRRRARRTRPRLRAALGGLCAAGALAGAAVAGEVALTSPRFAVASMEVEGVRRLSPEAIARAAGIAPGTNLFRVDPPAVAARLESLPGVRRADVIRAWPNRVTILVEERRPFTLVHAGRLHWIDEDGVPMGEERAAVVPPAPVISGLDPEELATMRERPSPRAQEAIRLTRLLLRSGSPLVDRISEVDVSRADDPVLYTVDGVEVRLGTEDWEGRLARLEGVLAQVASAAEPVTTIDLRFRDQVVLNGGLSR